MKYKLALSLKTAVTWLKPLREKDRTLSTPSSPDNAVSIGNVTRFSISTGPRAGTTVLICTCLLVMSGVTSMGRRLELPGAGQGHDNREKQDQPARADRVGQDGIDHHSSFALLIMSALIRKALRVATCVSGLTPETMRATPPLRAPTSTGWAAARLRPVPNRCRQCETAPSGAGHTRPA
jgi:hypothetical protein